MIIPVDYAQANFRFTGTGVPEGAEFTMGFNVELFSGTVADAATAAYDAWVTAGMAANFATTCALTSVLMKFGPNDTGPSAVDSGNVPGTNAGPQAPPNVAILVRKNTGFGGRAGRGRFFLPGFPEGNIGAAGELGGTSFSDLQSDVNALFNAWVTAGLVPTLLHNVGSPISAPIPITSFTVDSKVATQRRRLRR